MDISDIRNDLKPKGYAVIQYDQKAIHSYPYDSPWLDNLEFNEIFEAIRDYTLVDRTRCFMHYQLAQQVNKIEGDILEVGTWRGGTGGLYAKFAPEKTVYLADTFEGVVKAEQWEHYENKAHDDTSEAIVRELLDDRLKANNYKILRGIFPDDTGADIKGKKLALVHIDVDVYRSAKDIFESIWNQLSTSGIVVFDDYGFISACSGVYKFVEEIKGDSDKIFIHNINGHAYIIKK